MAMSTEQIIELMEEELKHTKEALERLEGQKDLHNLTLQTQGKYIILKQLLEVITL